jgi:acyl-coenzyme A synthetase/AMP-(fatty) acid ligase
VVDENGNVLPDGVEGELCVRGPHVFVGYRNLDPAMRRVDADGWLRTGDLGHRDADGYYFLHGRRDDVINCGGLKVIPLEVENCILEMLEVAEVAVGGAPHRVLGEVVKAFVIPRPGIDLDPKAVRRHCTRRLASHKVPFHVELVSHLPKNAVGKVVRRRLGTHEPQLSVAP